jgi:hypothetical protein
LYVLANKRFDFESDIIYRTPPVTAYFPKERESEERNWEEVVRFGGGGEVTIFPVLKVPMQRSLVLIAEAMHRIGINFYMTLEGLHYSDIITNIGKYTLGRNVDVKERSGRLKFGYQLSICSGTEENHEKTLIELAGRRTFRMQTDF